MKKIYLEWLDICECLERICAKVEGADFDEMYSMFADVEPADVRPAIRAHWINESRVGFGSMEAECSNCGRRMIYKPQWQCCPYCMAEIGEEQ